MFIKTSLVADHHGQGDPQPDRTLFRAGLDTGVAVPAFPRVSHPRSILLLRTKEYVFGANVHTLAAPNACFLLYDRRHTFLLSMLISTW